MHLTEKELHERDATRSIGEELLAAIKSVKAGCYGHRRTITRGKTVAASDKDSLDQPPAR